MNRRRARAAKIHGFTTIELLIATALLLTVTASVAALATPMRDAVERSLGELISRVEAALRSTGWLRTCAMQAARPPSFPAPRASRR